MHVLIIDNHSKHLQKLISLFQKVTIIAAPQLESVTDLDSFDCIVISGGSDVPTVLNHPEFYAAEIKIIKTTHTPIVGICLGCELLVHAYGGTLEQLAEHHRGPIQLVITDPVLERYIGETSFIAHEGHGVGIKTLPVEFITCARSHHGIEIIQHQMKPVIGLQFHPELDNDQGLFNWIYSIINTTKKNLPEGGSFLR